MIVNVASKNPIKVEAVRQTLKDYQIFSGALINPFEVNSGVSEQPISLEETVKGAVNRASSVFTDCDYSFGIENGLMSVPLTKTGSMDFCACAIYDGKQHHLGLSCAFEFPPAITRRIHKEGINASEACYRLGLSKNKDIGSAEGIIGIVTKGRMTRMDYTIQAIQMALIHLENSNLY